LKSWLRSVEVNKVRLRKIARQTVIASLRRSNLILHPLTLPVSLPPLPLRERDRVRGKFFVIKIVKKTSLKFSAIVRKIRNRINNYVQFYRQKG
jgi:hypothetical protein